MDEKECKVCAKMMKEKYKHYKTWKILAIVFICISVALAILYFASGDLMTTRIVEYDNEVVIENGGDNNTNTDNGNIVVEKQNDNTGAVILLSVIILVGGIIGGCYIISSRNHRDKQQSDD